MCVTCSIHNFIIFSYGDYNRWLGGKIAKILYIRDDFKIPKVVEWLIYG